jgi:ribonucleotide reductase alpha subunit
MTELPEALRAVYRTAWELPMSSLIDMAADRGAFIDQSQSLNLFMESPNIGQLSSMYFYAWKKGLKTTYYLRSRPATRIAKATVEQPAYAVKAPEMPAPAPVAPAFTQPAAAAPAAAAPSWQSVAAPGASAVAVETEAPAIETPAVLSWTAAVPEVVAETPAPAATPPVTPAAPMTTPRAATPPMPVLSSWGAMPAAPAEAVQPAARVADTPEVESAHLPHVAPAAETPLASWGPLPGQAQPAVETPAVPAATWGAPPAAAASAVEQSFAVPDFLAKHELAGWSLEEASAAVACSLENPESCEACQ